MVFKKLLRKGIVSIPSLFILVLCVLGSGAVQAQQFNQKLFIPDTLSTMDHDTIHLKAVEGQKVFFPGATSSVIPGFALFKGDTMPIHTMSYSNPKTTNPGILGPTLVWWKGDSVTMAVENMLMDTTTTHWHGAHVAPYNDGGPHQMIPPHTTWAPSFKIRDDATTMWYHPHLHMMTMMQVNMGMAGLIMVKDKDDPFRKMLPHTYGVDEFPIILQDKFFRQNKSMGHDMIDMDCSMGTTFLVNGTWQPYLDVEAQKIRFRILNGSSERAYCVFIRDSTAHEWVPFQVIASDAGYLDVPYQMGTPPSLMGNLDSLLMIMSGERYEIVFDAAQRQGHELYLMNMRNLMVGNDQVASFAGGPNLNDPGCYANLIANNGMLPSLGFDSTALPLMKINVGGAVSSTTVVPSAFRPYEIPNENEDVVVRNKSLVFYNSDSTAPPFSIDSVNFVMDVINDTVYLDDVEVWNVKNISGVAHPFHIHDIHFFIRSINGDMGKVPPYMRGPKDVAPVTDSSNFKLIMKFTDFATPIDPKYSYMYHCHILAHEDGGMMHQFVVTPRLVSSSQDAVVYRDLEVYPNPVKDMLTIGGDWEANTHISLSDMMHHEVASWPLSAGKQLNTSSLPNGVYLLKINEAGRLTTKRIVVMH